MDIVDIDRNDVIDGPSDVIHHGVLDHEKGLLIAASKRHESANVDEFLLLTGEYGRGQKCLTFFLCLFMFGATYNILSTVFVTLNSSWRCSAYGVTQGACLYNGTIDENHELYEKRCEMNRTSWEFEREAGYSIVTEFDLVCDRKVFAEVAKSASFLGGAIGTVILGILSDRYGRKPVLFVSYFIVVSGSLIQSFATTIHMFILIRFIFGLCLFGVLPVIYIILVELVGTKKRALASHMIWIAFASSACLLSVQAYYVQEWRTLIRIITAPYLVLILFWKLIPESMRWLRVNQRTEEAEKIYKNIARFNNIEVPDVKLQEIAASDKKVSMKVIFQKKKIILFILTHGVLWCIYAIIYYGISSATTYLSNNVYTDFFVVSAVNFPAVAFSIYGCNRFGRRKTTMAGTLSTFILLVVIAVVPVTADSDYNEYSAIRSSFGVLAKFFISISYSSIYLLSCETYPTVIRSRVICMLEFIMLIAGATAPWLSTGLHQIHTRLPFPIMAVLCALAGWITTMLKETKDTPTPELLDDRKAPTRIKSLIDNVRDSHSISSSRTGSENRLSLIYDAKQTTVL